jgi:hypothetical protein
MTLSEKGGKKIISIQGFVCILLISICLMASLIESQEAYADTKKVSGAYKNPIPLTSTLIRLANSELRVFHVLLKSSDPDWNNARLFYIEYPEPTEDYHSKGFGTITHPGGDQTFIEYVNKLTPTTGGADRNGEINGSFIGGTGKFKAIRARWLVKWKNERLTVGFTSEWEIMPF